jgi:hypothetical protein
MESPKRGAATNVNRAAAAARNCKWPHPKPLALARALALPLALPFSSAFLPPPRSAGEMWRLGG